jgi:hypothetical protein
LQGLWGASAGVRFCAIWEFGALAFVSIGGAAPRVYLGALASMFFRGAAPAAYAAPPKFIWKDEGRRLVGGSGLKMRRSLAAFCLRA